MLHGKKKYPYINSSTYLEKYFKKCSLDLPEIIFWIIVSFFKAQHNSKGYGKIKNIGIYIIEFKYLLSTYTYLPIQYNATYITYHYWSFAALEEHPDFNKDGMILDTIEKGVNFPVIHILRITEPPPPSTSTTTNNTSTTQGMYKNRVKNDIL